MKLLMIDNYDSFTYNLVQYFGELGAQVEVLRNDEITVAGVAERRPDLLVVSPGPCSPAEAGISVEAIQHFAGKLPILGVCLGHQSIGAAFGGKIVRAQQLMHGKTSEITTTRRGRVCRAAGKIHRQPLPLAGDRAIVCPRRTGDDRLDRRRRDHGRAPHGNLRSASRACSSIPNPSSPSTATRC